MTDFCPTLFKNEDYFVNFLERNTVIATAHPKMPTRKITGVIFSPVLGRTFFFPVFGVSSLTEVDDEFDDFGSVWDLDGSGSGFGFGSG